MLVAFREIGGQKLGDGRQPPNAGLERLEQVEVVRADVFRVRGLARLAEFLPAIQQLVEPFVGTHGKDLAVSQRHQ